jgi:hypothetical protein
VSEVSDDRPLAIVDIDGVVADVRHRLHHVEKKPKDWDAFFRGARQDALHPEGKAIVERLRGDNEIVYLTGRPQWLEKITLSWLDRHGLGGHRLVMRSRGDRRPAAQAKVELLRTLAAGRTVAVVVDDDERVLEAMAAAGFPTFHADWERRAIDEQRALEQAQEDEGRT